MIWFFIKKNFCDGWDNLLSLAFYNLVTLALAFGGYFFAQQLADKLPALSIIVLVLFALLIVFLQFAVNQTTAKYADFKYVSIKDTLLEIPSVWRDALLFLLVLAAVGALAAVGLPFYFQMGTMAGLFLGAVVFWLLLAVLLSLQWFLPIKAQLGDPFLKALKKCFIVFFDNIGFSIFMFVYALFLAVLSVVPFATLIPGCSGLMLAYNNAFRLRLYKYDWLEEHSDIPPKEARKQIPWAELLAEDNETLGPRNLRSFLFPWK